MAQLPDATIPAVLALVGTLALESLKRRFSRPKEASDEATQLRMELRAENVSLKKEKSELESAHRAHLASVHEAHEKRVTIMQSSIDSLLSQAAAERQRHASDAADYENRIVELTQIAEQWRAKCYELQRRKTRP